MSLASQYPVTAFSETQTFLVWNPSTQTLNRVQGSDLVNYITPGLGRVYGESTRAAALNGDYAIGNFIQTAGGSAIGDGGNGTYLVVEGGTGDYPMLNGNDLLLLPFGSLAGSDLDGALVTDETATPIEDAVEKRAVRFANLEAFRASSCSYPEVIIEAANAGTTTGRMILKATGTAGGTPTATGDRFTALAAGEIVNSGGYGYGLDPATVRTPEIFGAPGNNTEDNLTAINLMFSSAPNYSEFSFDGGVTYRVTGPVVIPDTKIGFVVRGNGAAIRADHNGDGLVLTSLNQNYSRHKIYDLRIQGPNASYPANAGELAGTSTGDGIKIGRDDTTLTATGYLMQLTNVTVQGFYRGIYLQNPLLCNFVGGYVAFNQYGIFVDGGQTNANTFIGVHVRENRKVGIYSSGRTGGTLTNSTHNVFISCEIETNIPYNLASGGYPSTYDAVDGVGVQLRNSYDWIFNDCYMENHNRSVVIESSSDDNRFHKCRFNSLGVRPGTVQIVGPSCNGNAWSECKMADYTGYAEGTFQVLDAGAINNQLLDCTGFSLVAAYVLAQVHVVNLKKAQANAGQGNFYGAITMPPQGYVNNPAEGTAQGTITGIGTTSATLNAFGVGEIQLGSNITAATEITTISGGSKGQFLAIVNYQNTYAVTIKSALTGTGGIVLNSFADAVMNNYGQMILLYRVGVSSGRWYEVGRNF